MLLSAIAIKYILWPDGATILLMVLVYQVVKARRSWLYRRRRTLWLEEDFVP
ncbi:hypothetical protein FLA_2163 [Filimonas lacunae]|nr:hypothetical protein FLA_2163 [Filimonas lacunae]